MKDWKLFVAYALFASCIVCVCIWGITQDYKYGGNPEVVRIEHDIDTIVVYKDGRDYDWEIFTQALIWVESKGDSQAVGSKADVVCVFINTMAKDRSKIPFDIMSVMS